MNRSVFFIMRLPFLFKKNLKLQKCILFSELEKHRNFVRNGKNQNVFLAFLTI